MQKVITIHGVSYQGRDIDPMTKVREVVYPELQKLLDEGYIVKEAIPMKTEGPLAFAFSITFILEKPANPV